MKKLIFAHLAILLPTFLNAQNIGIGDPTPSAKLTVRGGESTADGQAAAIKLQNTTSTNSWFLRAGGLGTNTPGNGFSIGDNLGYHLVISQGGNTGIGINPATAKLHVNGSMKLEGTSLLEFGAGIAGKELNAGKIGYNGFGTNALAIVGAGTNTTNRAVYFFAEGGTTFSGPINVRGNLQIHGNSGTEGQVLTSNGTSAPTWNNAAFGNNTRFFVTFSTFEPPGTGTMDLTTTTYNLDPSNIIISATSVTINKTGLYRLNGTLVASTNYSIGGATPAWEPELDCWIQFNGGLSDVIKLSNFDHLVRMNSLGYPFYNLLRPFSIDIYLVSGTIITIRKTFNWIGSGSSGATVKLFGNLIAE